jgi:copper chaperone CopZ
MMNAEEKPAQDAIETRDIGIAGMTCDKCVARVEKALRSVAGVREVRVSRQPGRATVQFDQALTNLPALEAVIAKSGYQPVPSPSS